VTAGVFALPANPLTSESKPPQTGVEIELGGLDAAGLRVAAGHGDAPRLHQVNCAM